MATQQHTQAESRTWQLQGDSAEAYERHLVPQFMAQGAQILVSLAGLGEGDRVLDVATGTGIVARTAAPVVGATGSIDAVDLNTSMLAVARKQSAGLQPAITWRLGDAHDLPYRDATFDVVFCQQGLQFFRERDTALAEMYRVLVPGGRVAVSLMRSVEHNPSYRILADVVARYLDPEAGATLVSPFARISTAELRDLMTATGFREVQIIHGHAPARYESVEEFARLEASSSPLATSFGALPEHERETLLQDLRVALGDYVDDQGIVFPTAIYVATGKR